MYTNTNILTKRAKRMLLNPTPAEKIFSARLMAEKIHFRQQFVIEPYIADFVMGKTIIELDGSSHDGREEYDAKRDLYLYERGYKIIRVLNKDAEKFDLTPFKKYKNKKTRIPKKKVKFKSQRRQMQQDRFERESAKYEMVQMPNGDFKKVKL